jgi:hypothetical protein
LGVVMDDGQVDGVRQRGFAARRVVMPATGSADDESRRTLRPPPASGSPSTRPAPARHSPARRRSQPGCATSSRNRRAPRPRDQPRRSREPRGTPRTDAGHPHTRAPCSASAPYPSTSEETRAAEMSATDMGPRFGISRSCSSESARSSATVTTPARSIALSHRRRNTDRANASSSALVHCSTAR